MVPTDLRYTKDHEWVRVDGDEATVGITEYAANQLGDIVFVELPGCRAGRSSSSRRSASSSRSRPSATCSRRSPARCSRRTTALAGSPELVNGDPYGDGWMIRLRLAEPGGDRRPARRGRLRRADRGRLSVDAVRTPYRRRSRADARGARDRQRRRALRGHPRRRSGRAGSTCRTPSRSSSSRPASKASPAATGRTSPRSSGPASTATGRRRRSISCSSAASGTRPTRRTSRRSARGRSRASTSTSRSSRELVDLDVVSASHYDGAAATAEAALMTCRATRRERVLVSRAVHPHYRADGRGLLRGRPAGRRDPARRRRRRRPGRRISPRSSDCWPTPSARSPASSPASRTSSACSSRWPRSVGLPTPPGRSSSRSSSRCRSPSSRRPGAYGADIAAGEGQPLGIAPQYGGPYLGLLASTDALVRQIPGRLVGMTTDLDGKRAFVMTMRAREQDIRRDKAASNICTNQALLALAASIYVATLGPHGLRDVAALGAARAAELEAALAAIGVGAAPSGRLPQRVRDQRAGRAGRPSPAARSRRPGRPRPRRRRAR